MHEIHDLTTDPGTRRVLHAIRDAIDRTIREASRHTGAVSLRGLYVHGSLVAGDFDPEISDVNLIAVLSADPDDALARDLGAMHDALAREHPKWRDRIEVAYVSESHLRSYRTSTAPIAVISPGEPFHVLAGGPEWILAWYPARRDGRALIGPPPTTVIPEIGTAEFLEQLGERLLAFRADVTDDGTRGSCAYAILTMCRGLHTLVSGARSSKREAARWATAEFPSWKELIEAAWTWRKEQWKQPTVDPSAARETRRFVEHMERRVRERAGEVALARGDDREPRRPVEIRILGGSERGVLDRVASGVFDGPIDDACAREFFADPRHHLAVALDGGTVVGMVTAVHYVHPDKRPELWIDELGVAATHRRQGLGKRLLEAMLAHGRALGCREAWVLTDRDNAAAGRLYASAGGNRDDGAKEMYTFRLVER